MPPLYIVGTAAVTENLLKRKWSTIILRHLDRGLSDPAEICKLEPDLTPPALNERLRTMLRYSLVTRYPRRGEIKMVEYRLTLRGQKILKMLTLIEHLDELTDKTQITLQDDERDPVSPSPAQNESSTKKTSPKKARDKSIGRNSRQPLSPSLRE